MRAQINHLMSRCPQLAKQLFFQNKRTVISGYSDSHVSYSPLSLVRDPADSNAAFTIA